jgi:hypothetical protein
VRCAIVRETAGRALVFDESVNGFSRYDRKLWIVEPVTPAAYLPA